MSKGSSQRLYRLVKSLSGSEKGHFKKFALRYSKDTSRRYLRLFNIFSSLNTYSDTTIEESFSKISTGSLTRTKSYLYDQIIDSLDTAEKYSSIQNDIKVYLRRAEILFEKRLLKDCRKEIQKAKKLAWQYDYFDLVLEAVMWQRKVAQSSIDVKEVAREFKELEEEEERALKQFNNLVTYRNLFSKVYINVRRKEVQRELADSDVWGSFIKSDLFNDESLALNFSTQILYFNSRSSFFYATGQLEKTRENIHGLIRLLENNPSRLKERLIQYFSALNNLIAVCDQLNLEPELMIAMDKLRSIPERYDISRHPNIETLIFESTYLFELLRFNRSGRFSKSMWLAGQIESKLEYFESLIKPSKKMLLYITLAVAYFGDKNYSGCNRWLNKLFNLEDLDRRQSLYNYAFFLHLISHYEMRNTDTIEYILRTSYKEFYTEAKVGRFEELMFNILRKYIKTGDELMSKELIQELFVELSMLEKEVKEKETFYYFNFLAWARSKTENIDYKSAINYKP